MTLASLRERSRTRLSDGGAYSNAEIDAALNSAMRVFAFLTLCIERQMLLPILPGGRFMRMLTAAPDFLVPLRVELRSTGALFDQAMFDQVLFDQAAEEAAAGTVSSRLRPAQAGDFRAENDEWLSETGAPRRYAVLGFDLLVVDRTVLSPAALLVKYAALPAALTADGSSPEIPESHHEHLPALVPFLLQAREGGSIHAKTRPGLQQFADGARQLAEFVRARALAQRYDREPSEITLADLSQDPKARKDLEAK